MAKLPPEILKILEQVVNAEKERNKQYEVVKKEICDAVADLNICLSPTGLAVMCTFSGVFGNIMNNALKQAEKDAFVTPRGAVIFADQFMRRWVQKRDNGEEEWNESGPFIDSMFQDVPEVKVQ